MGWWMVFGGVLWLFFWGSVIFLIFYAVTRRGDHDGDHEAEPEAMEIARRRLARGEITPTEFQEIASHLRPTTGST